jgi:GTP-binding protein
VEKRRIVTESPSPAKAAPHPLHHAEFVDSVAKESQLPPPGAPEIAFAGPLERRQVERDQHARQPHADSRSRARCRAARSRSTFFRLRSGALLADLPGYGYAAVPRELKEHWQRFLSVTSQRGSRSSGSCSSSMRGTGSPNRIARCSTVISRAVVPCFSSRRRRTSSRRPRSARPRAQSGREIASAFPFAAAQVTVVPFSATRRIGVEAAEATLADWLPDAIIADDQIPAPADANSSAQRRGPASKGNGAGPKYPR